MDNNQNNQINNNLNQGQPIVPGQTPTAPKKPNTGLIVGLVIALSLILVVLPIAFGAYVIYMGSNLVKDAMEEGISIDIDDDGEISIGKDKDRDIVKTNPVAGTWNCARGTGSTNDKDNFSTTLELNDDMSYRYGQYGDLENNHYSGSYKYEDEKKQTADGSYKYYMVTMSMDEMMQDGKDTSDQMQSKESQMEMGITEEGSEKTAITIFTSSYNIYYCYAE